jgi:hypothetical protein
VSHTICNILWSRVAKLPLAKSSLAAAILAAVSFQPVQAAIMIDDFITFQEITATASVPTASSSVAAPEVIGGERDMSVSLVSGFTTLSLSVNPFGGDLLVHDSGASVIGSSTIVWDGPDGDPTALDPTGLGGVDLTDGGMLDKFRLSYLLADLTGEVTMTVYDASDATGDTWSQTTMILPGGIFAPVDVDAAYTDFATAGPNGAASFNNVGAISMSIANTSTGSLDVLISRVQCVPEPSAGILSMLGIGGAFLPLRRLRRR